MAAESNEVTVTFVGTATVMLRGHGFTVLTDPNFLHRGERAYLGMGLSTRRLTEPALNPDELPPLDFVVLSHHHGDHFDRRAAASLDKGLPIVTEPHAAAKLRRQGFQRPVALRNWESETFHRSEQTVSVTSVPARHAPSPLDRVVPPVMGSVLDFTTDGFLDHRIYLSGDTLLHDRLAEIPARFPAIDLCLIHLGGTRVAGVLLTMDGDAGARALQLIAPRMAIPIHFDDYTVFKSSLDDFRAALDRRSVETSVVYLDRGQSYTLPSRREPSPLE